MIEIKTQIVFSYEAILNFSSFGRKLMTKYSRFANQRKIENTGAPAERVILVFGDERYYMDCNWERISFVAQGSRESFRKENGKTRFFFDLLGRIAGLSDFTEFKNMTISCSDLAEKPDEGTYRLDDFTSYYLSSEALEAEGELEDVLLVLESTSGSYTVNHSFGPFNPESDIKKHDLLVFKGPDMQLRDRLEEANGLLSKAEIIYEGVDMNLDRFIDGDEIRHQLTQNLENQWRN
jgi:hypothetical protein